MNSELGRKLGLLICQVALRIGNEEGCKTLGELTDRLNEGAELERAVLVRLDDLRKRSSLDLTAAPDDLLRYLSQEAGMAAPGGAVVDDTRKTAHG